MSSPDRVAEVEAEGIRGAVRFPPHPRGKLRSMPKKNFDRFLWKIYNFDPVGIFTNGVALQSLQIAGCSVDSMN